MFETSVTLTHITPVPAGTSREDALALIHDAEHHIRCDPNMKSYASRAAPDPLPANAVPADIESTGPTQYFTVTDEVPTLLPKGIWDRDVVSDYEFTFTKDGSFVRTRCPLSVVLETRWCVRDAAAKDEGGCGLELVEVVEIKCSRLLAGVIKGQCEMNWKEFHRKILAGKA